MNSAIAPIATLWGIDLQPGYCPRCGVAHLIPAEMAQARCPACFEVVLENQPTVLRPEAAELLADFTVTPAQARVQVEAWLKGVWLRPKELDAALLAQRLTKTFWPMWLVDGQVSGQWQAMMGYDYQVASSQERFRDGRWSTRQVTETRIRWEPRAGAIDRPYQNLSVPALEEHARLAGRLGPYELAAARAFAPEALAQASVRVPSLLPEAAWPQARSGFDRLAAADCQRAADAQHVDEFTIQASYDELHWTQLLLPLYTTAYRDDRGQVVPVLINGQSGKIAGLRRASTLKARNWALALAAIAIGCFVLGLIGAAATSVFPPASILSLICFLLSLGIGVCAPLPAIWAWNFNRNQKA